MPVVLDPLRDLLDRVGNPQLAFRTVHVAGTKGKGSVAALIEAGLHRAGLKVGRFSSPHVERVTERVTFGGHEIDERSLAAALERAWSVREEAFRQGGPGYAVTRFDLETLAAILAFAEAGVDWAILECGMGGRSDSTNVVDGEVAVLTNVGLEHTAILGTTHTAIAYQKVGILKRGATLVTAVEPDGEAGAVVRAAAEELGCPIVFRPPRPGEAIAEINTGLAQAVLDELGRRGVSICRPDLPPGPVAGWLVDAETRRAARLPGRMERFDLPLATVANGLDYAPRAFLPVILDGAHVPFNLEAVLADLGNMADLAGPCAVVFGLGRDKQAREMLNVLKPHASIVICTRTTSGPPSYEPSELRNLADSLGLAAVVAAHPGDAVAKASAFAAAQDWILVTGSLHVVGAVRPILHRLVTPRPDQL
ncbi:Mur ligase family protein [Aquabacter sp. CN5-332]|uniref:bifunctional folylpolyglutamate synthase/dihydrofolate synthase n=1 Tax=Aquabacter sp. CN5-332 TaxID=3156608 RepID=UPI0032B4EB3B